MDRKLVLQRILKILGQKQFLGDVRNTDVHASLMREYGFNSISIVELIMAIEAEFDFEFDDTELGIENYESINTIVDTVMRCLQNSPSLK